MKKYFSIFAADWQNQFVYRTNFLLWRVRNILRLLMTYFLWNSIFQTGNVIFGYSRTEMMAYVFLVLIIQSFVLSAPSADNIGGEISSGDLSNFLVKPISYLKYWFTRDLSSKLLNLIFSLLEISLLWLILRPELYLSLNIIQVTAFIICCALAVCINYFLNLLARIVTFWAPEYTWGLSFLLIVFVEIFSGLIFPLDILPPVGKIVLQLTPFPYLVYYPISILIGKTTGFDLVRILIQSSLWLAIVFGLSRYFWHKGLKVYGSEGH